MHSYISAIFDTPELADKAIAALRHLGVSDNNLSIVSRQSDYQTLGERIATEDVGDSATAGLVGGASVGALFGLAAVFIPGVGPFIAAGSLAAAIGISAATVATGAITGASAGALAGALAQIGLDSGEASFYSVEIELGRVFVSINADPSVHVPHGVLRDVLSRHGGRSPSTVAAI